MKKVFNIRYGCGHTDSVMIEATEKVATSNAALTGMCRRCSRPATVAAPVAVAVVSDAGSSLAIDLTTPAGSEMAVVNALQQGWSEEEIIAGARFQGRETFICTGCKRRFPRSLAMSASLGISCPNCYDDLAG